MTEKATQLAQKTWVIQPNGNDELVLQSTDGTVILYRIPRKDYDQDVRGFRSIMHRIMLCLNLYQGDEHSALLNVFNCRNNYEKPTRLIIGRSEGKGFYIGKDVHVQIHDIRRNSVRVAIEAPSAIDIIRDELIDPAPEV